MKLNEICEVYSGYALKSFNDVKDGLPVVKIGNILTDGTLNIEECQYTTDRVNEKYYSQKDDIYIALSGATTGKIGIMNTAEKHVINQRVGIVRQKSNNVPQEYIKYFLFRQTDRILQEAAGCAQPIISPKQIAEYIVPDISRERMLEICNILDKTKRLVDNRKAELIALDDLIKARFVEMFGDETEYPFEPLNCNVREMFIGPFGSSLKNECFVDEAEGYCMVYEQKHAIQKTMDLPTRYVDEKKYQELKRFSVYPGDIVVSCRGTIGEVFVVPDQAPLGIMHPSIMKIRLNTEKYNQRFFVLALERYMEEHNNEAKGSGVKMAVTATTLGKELFVLPPIDVQEKFADFVKQVDKSKFVAA